MIGVVALWLLYSAVDVVGDGDCPAAAEVSHRLAELVPATDGGAELHRRARLSRTGTGVHVELLSAAGERIAERYLGVDASCDDLAAATAVIIATWEAELDPRVTPRVSLRTPPPQTTPVTTTVRATPPPPPPQSPTSFDLGLALMASLTGGEVVPGARVGAWIAPGGWRLGLGAAVSATTARSEPVGPNPGAARWTRYALGAGPEARFTIGRMMVGAHARALAALLHVQGVGLPTTASDSTAQLGTGAGVHVGRPWGNATPWIGADLLFWPGRDRLQISGLAAQGELPRLELQLALGLSIGRFP